MLFGALLVEVEQQGDAHLWKPMTCLTTSWTSSGLNKTPLWWTSARSQSSLDCSRV